MDAQNHDMTPADEVLKQPGAIQPLALGQTSSAVRRTDSLASAADVKRQLRQEAMRARFAALNVASGDAAVAVAADAPAAGRRAQPRRKVPAEAALPSTVAWLRTLSKELTAGAQTTGPPSAQPVR
eukprot:SAG11_NODE_1134_length_5734_cov_4.917480_1_plen_126_part_00